MKNHYKFLLAIVVFIICASGINAQTTYYIDDDLGDDTRTNIQAQNPATPWQTIQKGINSAIAGDILSVFPGTYPQQLTISKPLTIRGATYLVPKNGYPVPANYAWDDNVESIIDCPAGVQRLISIQNISNITLEGFVIQALNRDNNSQNHLIFIFAQNQSLYNLNIRNNVIGPNTNLASQDGTRGRMNIYVNINREDYGLYNSLFEGNKIFDAKGNGPNMFFWGSYAVYSYSQSGPMYGTVVRYNEIYGSHRSGIEIAGGIEGLALMYNTIYNNSGYPTDPPNDLTFGNGILILRGSDDLVSGENADGCTLLGLYKNEIFGNQKNGIYMGPINSNHIFTGNNIYNNGWNNICLDLDEKYYLANPNNNPVYNKTSGIYLRYSNLLNSGLYGITVEGTPTNGFILDGLYNYWDDQTGPSGAGAGTGDPVSLNINFSPWVDDDILQYERNILNVPMTVGPAGGQINVAITSVPGISDFLDIYQTGLLSDPEVYSEDFTTNNTGCIKRYKILWGIVETGSVTSDLVFDYSNQPGISDPSKIYILRRDNAVDPDWELVPITSRNDLARTITISGVSTYGEYVLGEKSKIWTAGAGNTDWNEPGNWFQVGVPTNTDDLLIPAGLPFYPESNTGAAGICLSIEIEPGAHVFIPANNSLTVLGDMINNGDLQVMSNNTGQSGSFIDSGVMSGSGTFSFNRNMTTFGPEASPQGWHLFSSPVDGMSNWDVFNFWLSDWNETINSWFDYAPGGDIPCVPAVNNPWNTMKGYGMKRDVGYTCEAVNPGTGNRVEFAGNVPDIHTGNYSIAVTGTDFEPGNPNGNNNWNLVGNPYPSAVDFDAWTAQGGVPMEVDWALYLWDDAAQLYRSWVGGIGYTPYIPPAQGFFVHVNTPGTWNLNISNMARTHSGTNDYFKSSDDKLIVLEAAGNNTSDITYIRMSESATTGFDNKLDAYKMFSQVGTVPQIYTKNTGINFSINSMPETDIVPVTFKSGTDGLYTIRLTETQYITTVLLEDVNTGDVTDVTKQDYSFSYDAATGEYPFNLYLKAGEAGSSNANDYTVICRNHAIYILNPFNSEANVKVTTMTGNVIYNGTIGNGLNSVSHLADGIFIVTISGNEKTSSTKVLSN